MGDGAGKMDHEDRLSAPDRKPAAGICGRPHPLLEDVWCERLRGHPGEHGAYLDAASTEMTIQWKDGERIGQGDDEGKA